MDFDMRPWPYDEVGVSPATITTKQKTSLLVYTCSCTRHPHPQAGNSVFGLICHDHALLLYNVIQSHAKEWFIVSNSRISCYTRR